jgi:hypothetical protein
MWIVIGAELVDSAIDDGVRSATGQVSRSPFGGIDVELEHGGDLVAISHAAEQACGAMSLEELPSQADELDLAAGSD